MTLQPVMNILIKIITDILNFLPRLVNGLLLLIIGYVLSIAVRWLARFIFRKMRIDHHLERTGITHTVQSLGIRPSLSEILAQIIFFFLLLSFLTSAVNLMEFTTVADLLQSILHFIPKAISAAIIVIFGTMFAHFLGTTVETVASSVRITNSRVLGRLLEYTIVAFVLVLAISTLGVDTTILTTGLALIVAAAGLALALTFAFGSRESARHVIAGFYVRQRFRPGQQLTVEKYSGTIRFTTGTYTVLAVNNEVGEQQTLSLPNAFLLQNAVLSQDAPAPGSTPAPKEEPPAPTTGGTPVPKEELPEDQ